VGLKLGGFGFGYGVKQSWINCLELACSVIRITSQASYFVIWLLVSALLQILLNI